METATISKEEYEQLTKYKELVHVVEAVLHNPEEEQLLSVSESTAQERWDNKTDEIWNTV